MICSIRMLAVALALATASVSSGEAATDRAARPNIVYVMADELGYYELSCMGHPHFHTPHIDRMAAEGVRFTQCLAGSAVCAPTRCVLMTGKHSGHTSVRVNGGGTPLRADEATIASVLKKRGYATGGFGKWGCGGRGSTGVPEKHGFDTFVGYYDQVHAHSYFPPYIVRNSEEVVLPGNKGGTTGQTYSHYVIVDEAMKFITEHKDQPFFCYLPITPPHGLFNIPDEDPAWALFRDKPWPEDAKRYAAMVSMVDRQMGDLLQLLKQLQLEDNTIVFFSGDNGGMDYFRSDDRPRGFHGPNVNPLTGQEFRGQKGNLYEGGLRIPMIVRWPGRIAPARVSDLLCYFPDILPTMAELADITPPEDIDGISLVPELLGASAAGREQDQHEYLYWEIGRQTAVRMNNWKAVRPRSEAAWELYDLNTDPGEQNNVAAEHADIAARMEAFAAAAHQPAVEGTFHDPAIHEKDRQAKWGRSRAPEPRGRMNSLSPKGLLDRSKWKLVRVSSEAQGNRKLAVNAFDGDSGTWWHSAFQPELQKHPHELVIDLGAEHSIRGFRYLARQDSGWNGALQNCEFFVSSQPDQFDTPVAKAVFGKVRTSQEVACDPVSGRYVLLRVLSEVNGGPWASVAEIGVVGE